MPREIVFLRQEFTTRRYAFIWISVWLILLFATWFSRPLLPFQETLFSGIVWELYQSGSWLYPRINEAYQHSAYPLDYWISLVVWEIFGVSEFSLRVVASFFSLGTLFLTAWAAYQLWPDKRAIRANAPLVLIGSLMWTVFATANVEYVYFTFYLMLSVNFLIRVWRFKQDVWWIGYTFSLTLGLYSAGLSFLAVMLPIVILAPYWSKKRWKEIYAFGGMATLFSIALFLIWVLVVSRTYHISLFDALGFKYILKAFVQFPSIYIYIINLVIVLFPWLFWLRLYRLYRIADRDDSFRFVEIWFFSLVVTLGVLSLTSLEALLPIYPAFALGVARIYQSGFSRKRDVFPIALLMMIVGLLMIIIPHQYLSLGLPEWVGQVSPFWGAGLILFGVTLIFNAENTRIMTLALMSIALTLAINFGVVRVATDFYDLKPMGERLSWYQSQSIMLGHSDNYKGHLHFVGKLEKPLIEVVSLNDLEELIKEDERARVVLYVENHSLFSPELIEYWQPFRGKYLVVFKASGLFEFMSANGVRSIGDIQ